MENQWIHPVIRTFLKGKMDNFTLKKKKILATLSQKKEDEIYPFLLNILPEFLPKDGEPITDLFEFTTLIQAFYELPKGNWPPVHFRGENKDYGKTQKLCTYFREQDSRSGIQEFFPSS